jgi:hypothetical protein
MPLTCAGCGDPIEDGQGWPMTPQPPEFSFVFVHRNNVCWRTYVENLFGPFDTFDFVVMFFSSRSDDDDSASYDSLVEAMEVLGERGGIVWLSNLGPYGPVVNLFQQEDQ